MIPTLIRKRKKQIDELISEGAIVLDVRTSSEFKLGHVPNSINIPIARIASKLEELKQMDDVFVVCCASGIRSTIATKQLKRGGMKAINGGSWKTVLKYV